MALQACEGAATPLVRRRIKGADRVGFNGPRMSQASNAETQVEGTGEAASRSFTYRCLYNIRDGRTAKLAVTVAKAGGGAAAAATPGAPGHRQVSTACRAKLAQEANVPPTKVVPGRVSHDGDGWIMALRIKGARLPWKCSVDREGNTRVESQGEG